MLIDLSRALGIGANTAILTLLVVVKNSLNIAAMDSSVPPNIV